MKIDMKKLKSMKMPDKRMADSKMNKYMEDEDEEGSPEEEASESPEEESHEDENAEEGEEKSKDKNNIVASLSDDELIAEVKKRGLISKLEESEDGSESSHESEGHSQLPPEMEA